MFIVVMEGEYGEVRRGGRGGGRLGLVYVVGGGGGGDNRGLGKGVMMIGCWRKVREIGR